MKLVSKLIREVYSMYGVKMKKGEYPPESYIELIDFYKSMNKADNTKVVFVTKT